MKRVCLLTGASGLLGTAFARRYAAQYQIVAVHHLHPLRCATQDQTLVDPLHPSLQLAVNAHPVFAIRADLARPTEIDRLTREVVERFGGVDLLINGAACRHWSHLLDPSALGHIDEVLALNLLAPLRLAVALAGTCWRLDPEENRRKNRNIVNVSSTAGLFVYPDRGQALYGTSKAALNMLSSHLASEFKDLGVRVNTVAPDTFPGRIPTEAVLEAIVGFDASDQTDQLRTFCPSSTSVG